MRNFLRLAPPKPHGSSPAALRMPTTTVSGKRSRNSRIAIENLESGVVAAAAVAVKPPGSAIIDSANYPTRNLGGISAGAGNNATRRHGREQFGKPGACVPSARAGTLPQWRAPRRTAARMPGIGRASTLPLPRHLPRPIDPLNLAWPEPSAKVPQSNRPGLPRGHRVRASLTARHSDTRRPAPGI
jgi:hypothetical protein